MGTQVFFLNIDVSWKYIKKMKNIYVHESSSHFNHAQKNKILKIDPTLNIII